MGNVSRFVTGLLLVGLGCGIVLFSMFDTAWKTSTVTCNDYGEIDYVDAESSNEFGLLTFGVYDSGEVCEGNECEKLGNTTISSYSDDWPDEICEQDDDLSEEMCSIKTAGSTGFWILMIGVILGIISIIFASLNLGGKAPAWISSISASLFSVATVVSPFAWFSMFPDVKEIYSDPLGLSYSFFLNLLMAPLILVGGLVWNGMRLEDSDDDWDSGWDDDSGYKDNFDINPYAAPTPAPETNNWGRRPSQQPVSAPPTSSWPQPNWYGQVADDGYEWLEHPTDSGTWYWRDKNTGEWIRH